MKCHYDVLEVPKDATDTEIKTAYRKLALKWHPDKNLDNSNFAKEQFQIVQQAYEVLSDRQERAWYDAHRARILQTSSREDADKSLDVFAYFTTSCFNGYTDGPDGFYSVYRKVFEQITEEDIKYMDEKEEFDEIPSFGRSDSDSATVKAFYDHWMSYCTKKSYVWLDPFDIQEGRGDRRLLKIIEKENKKVRQKARKERNEEVRNLVAFVRKRDKRVQALRKEQEAKTLQNRKKQEELSKLKRLEQQKLHTSQTQADWLKFDNVKSELEDIERQLAEEFGESSSNSEEEDLNNLYCVACNKIFKTPKAFENHELSKKHRENVEKLRVAMMEEENSNLTDDELDDCDNTDNNKDGGDLENCIDEESDGSLDREIPELETLNEKKKKSKKKTVLTTFNTEDNSDNEVITKEEVDSTFTETSSKAPKKHRRSKTTSKNPERMEECKTSVKKRGKKKCDKEEEALEDIDISHCCVTCKTTFTSKNKLFEHLKKSNHGVYLPKTKPSKRNGTVKN